MQLASQGARGDRIGPTFDQSFITDRTTMVHEVPGWDSDSDYVEDEEHDELDQDSLMGIQDRVRPAELREMSVADICRKFHCSGPSNTSRDTHLTLDRTYT